MQCAYRLVDRLPDDGHRERLRELPSWLENNLATPSRFNRSRSKGYYRRKTRGISWFRDTTLIHLAKMEIVAAILTKHGLRI